MNKLSIKIKVFILISFVFTILISIYMQVNLTGSKKQSLQYVNNLNVSSAKLIHKNTKADLYNLNYTNVKNTIDSFDNGYFKDIYILNPKGFIFSQRESDKIRLEKHKSFEKFLNDSYDKEQFYFSPIKFTDKTIGYLLIEINLKLINQTLEDIRIKQLKIYGVSLVLVLIISYIISLLLTRRINKLVDKLKDLKPNENLDFEDTNNDEFSYLAKTIEDTHKKVNELNNNLEKRVKEEVDKNLQKDIMLQKQSIRASLGEMIDIIAHQWKQPLNVISMISQALLFREEITRDDAIQSSEKIKDQISHMVDTLDEFRGFFRDDKEIVNLSLKVMIEDTLALLKDSIKKHDIEVSISASNDIKAYIIQNEFKHVLINLISNTKDAFEENGIKERKITFKVDEDENNIIFKYIDNAGGIPDNIIDNIFQANFTTKSIDKGTGVGLYMSKMIIEKINSKIEVKNIDDGACFTITIAKEKDRD